jgi:hypothetical protein
MCRRRLSGSDGVPSNNSGRRARGVIYLQAYPESPWRSAKRDREACSESLEILIQGPQYGIGSQQH